ncbi:hypothetical protein DFJ58DRAFT_734671 [Suillus subalutaceus]|uniref:uncharacterized protein n=1 Tax=Suillus subalutaceus TaxID=48586 RepID=UPI001B880FD3|nr:uncharacterized protein DFJ58DRAFT_734671 [Suillus subalutaceus]KAG1836873.1 hypothetical protein DFJ58DRAFT_734671 [Suillus subalutaceus]
MPDIARHQRYIKVTKSSSRTPWRHRIKRKARLRTQAEKKVLAEKCRANKCAYKDALADSQDMVMQEAVKLHEEFPHRTVEYHFEAILQRTHTKQKSRKATRWNAFLRSEVKAMNAARAPDEPRVKATQAGRDIAAKWNAMSQQEKIDATEGLMEDLEDHRNNKALASHNVPINAFHDIRATLDSATQMLATLSARTGCHTALITVRGDLDHYNRPYVYLSDDRVGDFFQLALKETPSNFATRLEGYCTSGVTGVVSNYKQSFLQLKSKTSALILEKLREAAQVPVSRMYYVNFDENITAQHGVVLENWPLKKFASPGDIGSMVEVKTVYNAFMTGATKFRKFTAAEWRDWEETRFNMTLERSAEDDTDEGGNALADEGGNALVDEGGINTNIDPFLLSISQPVNTESQSVPTTRESAPIRRKRGHEQVEGGFGHVISGISGMGGDEVSVTKKSRKTRSDKGKKRGPKQRANQSGQAASS